MKMMYPFDADTGELVSKAIFTTGKVFVKHVQDPGPACLDTFVTVCEGETARREMFNYFGDSSWPVGWWSALLLGSR